MTSTFFKTQLPETRARLQNWWEHGDQDRPCFLFSLPLLPGAEIPDTEDLERWWMDVDFILEHQMAEIERTDLLGESAPFHYANRGSSAMEGVLGAQMKYIDKETVWAYPCFETVEQAAEVIADPANIWRSSTLEITRRSTALAHEHHFVAPYAMEGVSDILSGLYGTENLLMDMLEKPQAVEIAVERIKRIWIELFAEIQGLIAQSGNPGGIGWAGIWAPGTTFPLQEDFSYMISARLYRRFCLPHVADMIDAMDYGFYHLDGVGAIPHLSALLGLQKLRAIQWVPGTGKEELAPWHELIGRILAAGKSVEVFARPDEVAPLVAAVGLKGLLIHVTCSRPEAEALLSTRWVR